MFPLGTVLLPGTVIPLHVFEDRYRRLVRDCLEGTGEFGVVLIERGSEVGGGDVRTDAGTVARIVEATELPDGRWVLAAAGTRRIRVVAWLDDDPYPRADVDDWPDDPTAGEPEIAERMVAAATRLRRASALQAELGDDAAPLDVGISDDPVVAGYQIAALAPLGPLDRQRVLCASSAADRFDTLVEMLDDAVLVLEHRLREG